MLFGEMLRQLREEQHLTQRDLQTTGLSRVLLSHYEQGRRSPSWEHLQYLAERLDVSVDVFFEGKGTRVAREMVVQGMAQGHQAVQRQAWDDADALWAHVWTVARTYHLTTWAREAQWARVETAVARHAWTDVVTYALPWLANPEWGLPDDRHYRLLAWVGTAYRAINQLHSAALFYQLAQERVGAHSERGLRMAVNRGSCQWLMGQSAEAARLFDYARHEAAVHGYVVIEAWAAVGWTTVMLESDDLTDVEAVLKQAEHGARVMPDGALTHAIQQNWVVYARRHGEWERVGALLNELRKDAGTEPMPLSLLTEQMYWCTARHDWAAGANTLTEAAGSIGVGIEVQKFWEAVAHFYQTRQQGDRAQLARRLSCMSSVTWGESWQLFNDRE